MQQALPAALQARAQLQQTAAAAGDATYAAQHAREFAGCMRRVLPASLHRMEAALRDASWAACEAARHQREQHAASGGGGYLSGYLGGLGVTQRLADLWWQGGGSAPASARGGAGGADGDSDDGSMYR